jgi:hypothetical protein
VTRRSEFDRLKDVAKAASLGKFRQRLELLAVIDAIGPTENWLEGIPPGKIAHFAGEARVTDIANLRKVGDDNKRHNRTMSKWMRRMSTSAERKPSSSDHVRCFGAGTQRGG